MSDSTIPSACETRSRISSARRWFDAASSHDAVMSLDRAEQVAALGFPAIVAFQRDGQRPFRVLGRAADVAPRQHHLADQAERIHRRGCR